MEKFESTFNLTEVLMRNETYGTFEVFDYTNLQKNEFQICTNCNICHLISEIFQLEANFDFLMFNDLKFTGTELERERIKIHSFVNNFEDNEVDFDYEFGYLNATFEADHAYSSLGIGEYISQNFIKLNNDYNAS